VSAPDFLGPVVGFRRWRLVGDHLCSPYTPVAWRTRTITARCYPVYRAVWVTGEWVGEAHESPQPQCQCGVYATYAPPAPDAASAFLVPGIVSLWGRIQAHPEGMRAQHARVEALAQPAAWPAVRRAAVAAVAERLAVPVLDEPGLADAAREYGDTLPAALRCGAATA
jgi:hypothetical protein